MPKNFSFCSWIASMSFFPPTRFSKRLRPFPPSSRPPLPPPLRMIYERPTAAAFVPSTGTAAAAAPPK